MPDLAAPSPDVTPGSRRQVDRLVAPVPALLSLADDVQGIGDTPNLRLVLEEGPLHELTLVVRQAVPQSRQSRVGVEDAETVKI